MYSTSKPNIRRTLQALARPLREPTIQGRVQNSQQPIHILGHTISLITISILSAPLCVVFQSYLFPSGSSKKNLALFSPLSCVLHVTTISNWLISSQWSWYRVKIGLLITCPMQFYILVIPNAETSADTTKARNVYLVAELCRHAVLLDNLSIFTCKIRPGIEEAATQTTTSSKSVSCSTRLGYLD